MYWRKILPVATGALLTRANPLARLYVASYDGTVTTLSLDATYTGTELRALANTTACGAQPSWLTLDSSWSYLYCVDEAWGNPSGSVTLFRLDDEGSLTVLDSAEVIGGPVSVALFGPEGLGLAIASYSGSGLSVVDVDDKGELNLVQNETYTLDKPGPVLDRQEAPHPHQALLDPTGQFILVPDLGADLVRVYQTKENDHGLTAIAPLKLPKGAGPRHGVFKTTQDRTLFYVVTELANTIIGYDVKYNDDKTLSFSELFNVSIHNKVGRLAAAPAASEIQMTPDGRFLIVSSRWENTMNIPNFDPSNDTDIESDPLFVYQIDGTTGSLTRIQSFAAGGSGPRHFSLNIDGSYAAVGLQGDGRVVIIERDLETGMFIDYLGWANVRGGVNTVIFHDHYSVDALDESDVASS